MYQIIKLNICVVLFLLVIFKGTDCFANNQNISSVDNKINDKLNIWMHKNNIPGISAQFYFDDKPHSYYLGYADKEKKELISKDTIFEIGSITKVFTTVIFAEEVLAGKMQLEDKFAKYAPDITTGAHNQLKNITLKELAIHTSSLPFNVPDQINSKKKLSAFFAKWSNPYPINTKWLYSNVNIGLLGCALEEFEHKSIHELYDEKILNVLGMQKSGSFVADDLFKYYAQGYKLNGQRAPRRNITIWKNPPNGGWLFPAAGVLKSSGEDMLIFLKAALRLPGTPREINDAMKLTQSTFVSTSKLDQGLGWVIHPDPLKNKSVLLGENAKLERGPLAANIYNSSQSEFNANALIEKTGATGGFRSYIGFIPERKSGVVLLVNRYITSEELIRMGRELVILISTKD